MSNDKLVINDMIEINPNAVEPKDYFNILKSSVVRRDDVKELDAQLALIAENIMGAEKLGQKVFLDKLTFTATTIVKEKILQKHGYVDFVYKNNVNNFITSVEPKNSVKMIDLENYPRSIPTENMNEINRAMELNVFDKFLVVFTDLTDIDHRSEEQQEFLSRNRDPIVFGYFTLDKTTHIHERLYLITDWEDEYCELTYERMLDKMTELDIKDGHKLDVSNYLTELTNSVIANVNKEDSITTFYDRLLKWIKVKK